MYSYSGSVAKNYDLYWSARFLCRYERIERCYVTLAPPNQWNIYTGLLFYSVRLRNCESVTLWHWVFVTTVWNYISCITVCYNQRRGVMMLFRGDPLYYMYHMYMYYVHFMHYMYHIYWEESIVLYYIVYYVFVLYVLYVELWWCCPGDPLSITHPRDGVGCEVLGQVTIITSMGKVENQIRIQIQMRMPMQIQRQRQRQSWHHNISGQCVRIRSSWNLTLSIF